MSTTMTPTATPEVKPAAKVAPISLTPNAVVKVKEIMTQQNPVPTGLRVGVVGGGCWDSPIPWPSKMRQE